MYGKLFNNFLVIVIASHNESSPLFLLVAHNAPHSGNAAAVLQAPPEDVRSMRHVESPQRRIFAGMVKKLDESIGEIVNALLEKGILNNTIIAFISDNGGMTSGDSENYASNWPLRGLKMSPFEGGIRVIGLLWNVNLTDSSHSWKGYMHVSDWLPTLLKAVGAQPPPDLDGFDLWDNIINNKESKRDEIFEIDDFMGYASIISGDYKLVTGHVTFNFSNHQGDNLRNIIGNAPSYANTLKNCTIFGILDKIGKPFNIKRIKLREELRVTCNETRRKEINLCYPHTGVWCLYNIKEDPCEIEDISDKNPDIVRNLLARLHKEEQRTIPRDKTIVRDIRSSPRFHDYVWDIWADDIIRSD